MTAVPAQAPAAYVSRSARQLFWERFREDKAALLGLAVLGLMVVIATVGAPLVAKIVGHPVGTAYPATELDEFGIPRGITGKFWFGADAHGRDLLVRTLYGARTSLIVGLAATGIAVTIGMIVGLLAGFYGGWVDTGLSRIGDVMLSLPQLLIAVGIVASCSLQGCIGGIIQPGMRVVIGVIALFTWPYIARVVRSFTLAVKEREFVEASRSLGATDRRIIISEVMPNLIGPIIVFTTLVIPQNILFEASLSYLGVGESPSVASWGGLLNDATQNGNYQTAWWLMVFPGLFLVMTTLAFNLVGDGLRDALDVRTDH